MRLKKSVCGKLSTNQGQNTRMVDCFDIKPDRLKNEIENTYPDLNVITEHNAEDKYAVVVAASIVAKVERDLEIAKIRKNFKEIDPLPQRS